MISEVKTNLLREKRNKLNQLELIEQFNAEIDNEIQVIEQQLEETSMIPMKEFSWIQKHFTRRKEYRQYTKEDGERTEKRGILEEREQELRCQKRSNTEKLKEIEHIRSQISEMEKTRTLDAIGISFQQAVQLLKEHNQPLILTEDDSVVLEGQRKKEYKGVEDFVLVHKTRYAPSGSTIKTLKEANAIINAKRPLTINGKNYAISFHHPRNTLHFAVNGEVVPTGMGDDWSECKYTILIPFVDVPIETILNAAPMDTYTEGGVKLTPNAYILCPKGEGKRLEKGNPGVNVIEYEGENALGYGNMMVSLLGYQLEKITPWAWSDPKTDSQFRSIMKDKGLRAEEHFGTEEEKFDRANESIGILISKLKTIRNWNLCESIEQIQSINEQIHSKHPLRLLPL